MGNPRKRSRTIKASAGDFADALRELEVQLLPTA